MKRVLITGVSKGLGLNLAKGFAELGHDVAGCSRSASPPPDWSGKHYAQVDLSDGEAVERWSEEVLSDFGIPDLLINNAAIINRNAPLWEIDDAEFTDLVDINISGVARVIRHFIPAMIEQGSGVIVNFSSGWGRSTSPEVAPYCASKWAIEGLTQALAQELPHGLAAVSFNPGVINTDMLQSCFGREADQFPNAAEWAERAIPFLDQLTFGDNGQALTCP
ncbi:MAG: SDR family NAD(P)-dependent oxidoreductase [Verrucomicrobiota bacterium]